MKMNKLNYFPRYNSHICRVSCHIPDTWDLNLKQFEFRYMCILYSTIQYYIVLTMSPSSVLYWWMLAAIEWLWLVNISHISPLIGWHRQEADRQSSLQQTRRTNQLCCLPSLPSWLAGLVGVWWDVHIATHSTGPGVVSHHANKDSLGAQDCRDSQVFRRLIMWPLSSEQYKWR